MEDSHSPYAKEVRKELEEKIQITLNSRDLNFQKVKLDLGAYETILKAFARQLPDFTVKVKWQIQKQNITRTRVKLLTKLLS